jgi:hypothetical protein
MKRLKFANEVTIQSERIHNQFWHCVVLGAQVTNGATSSRGIRGPYLSYLRTVTCLLLIALVKVEVTYQCIHCI